MNNLNLLSGLILLSIISISCNKHDGDEENNQAGIREKFLVDKIYYHDFLLAEYIYENNNKLIKKIVTDTETNRRWEDTFEYNGGRVSKIIHDDQTYTFDYEIHLSYDSQGNLIRRETYVGGQLVGHSNFYYENGDMVSIYTDNSEPFATDTIVYDDSKNVTKHIHIYPELDIIDNPIEGKYRVVTDYFKFDDKIKPNFGLDYLFVYDPLPFTEAAQLERCLSKNNMIEFIDEGSTWIYTYDKNGLPATIERKWEGNDYLQPNILEITYRQIQ